MLLPHQAECATKLSDDARSGFAEGHDLVTDLDAGRLRAECYDLAGDLVPHRERQVHAAGFERNVAAIAKVEVPVPDVDVAMAHAGCLDPQQHLLAQGLGIGIVPGFERLPPASASGESASTTPPYAAVTMAD